MNLSQQLQSERRATSLSGARALWFLIIGPLLLGVQAVCHARQNSGATAPPPATAEKFKGVNQGYALLSSRNYAQAEAAFRNALAQQPRSVSATRGLALTLWNEGKKSEAVQEFTIAAQLSPGDFQAHYDLAKAAWDVAEQFAQTGAGKSPSALPLQAASYQHLAISEMRRALELRPNDAGVQLSLAQLYLEAGKPKDAATQAAQAATLKSSNPMAFLILGQAYFAQGDDVRATAEYQKAIQLSPHNPAPYLDLAQLQARARNLAGAETSLRNAIRADPTSASAYAALGQLLLEAHHGTQAQNFLARAVALNPSDWESQYRLGKILVDAGQFDQADTLFQKALKLHPDFPKARKQLALQMLRGGNFAGAEAQAQAIFSLNPQSPEGHQVMALVLWKQRNYDGSLAECAQALNGNPNSPRTLAVQALDLWQENRHGDAQRALVTAGKLQPKILSSEIFCRLVLCDAHDISIVGNFLQKNRWVLNPPPDY